ncbi:hypothetical protein [Pseudomonas phage Hadban]|nr:hypothetical protein [Pseudomonas phage Hadban]
MGQLAIMAEIERADVVVTLTAAEQGVVNASVFASEHPNPKALAKLLRDYADVIENQEHNHDS